MADQNLAVRLSVIDGGRVKAELRDVGESGARSLQRIETAAQPASRSLQALNTVSRELRGEAEVMAGRLGPVATALARVHPAALLAVAGIAAVATVITKAVARRRWPISPIAGSRRCSRQRVTPQG
jgi:hypothetical protein